MAQGYRTAFGPLTAFFAVQPVLMSFEAAAHWLLGRAGYKPTAGQRSLATVVLIFGTLGMFWCTAYMPPYSTCMFDTADTLLGKVGLAAWLPHVSVPVI